MNMHSYNRIDALNVTLFLSCFCLAVVLLLVPAEGFSRESKQKISPVCATADFMAFLEAYVLVPKEEQMSCIRFSDFTYKGKKISTPAQLIKSEAAGSKLLFSSQDINVKDKADAKFFYMLPANMAQNGPGFNQSCYVIRAEGKKRYVSLTIGGTFPFETVAFEWDGTNWRVLSYVQEDAQ